MRCSSGSEIARRSIVSSIAFRFSKRHRIDPVQITRGHFVRSLLAQPRRTPLHPRQPQTNTEHRATTGKSRPIFVEVESVFPSGSPRRHEVVFNLASHVLREIRCGRRHLVPLTQEPPQLIVTWLH